MAPRLGKRAHITGGDLFLRFARVAFPMPGGHISAYTRRATKGALDFVIRHSFLRTGSASFP
jgi:hypothetical protein